MKTFRPRALLLTASAACLLGLTATPALADDAAWLSALRHAGTQSRAGYATDTALVAAALARPSTGITTAARAETAFPGAASMTTAAANPATDAPRTVLAKGVAAFAVQAQSTKFDEWDDDPPRTGNEGDEFFRRRAASVHFPLPEQLPKVIADAVTEPEVAVRSVPGGTDRAAAMRSGITEGAAFGAAAGGGLGTDGGALNVKKDILTANEVTPGDAFSDAGLRAAMRAEPTGTAVFARGLVSVHTPPTDIFNLPPGTRTPPIGLVDPATIAGALIGDE